MKIYDKAYFDKWYRDGRHRVISSGVLARKAALAVGLAEYYLGRPIRNVELRVVDAEGQNVAAGAEGEILVRGPGVMKGYFCKPQETRKVIDEGRWFHTGDIGRLDEDGFLYITGRAKEMLIIGGENVFPREIESVLETHPGVLQAAVLGMGVDALILSFVVIVIGGLGSLEGALVGALIVSVVRTAGIQFFAEIELAVLYLIAATVLLIRPTGLFGRA